MAITISGENNNDKILASDGVIDQLSGINIVGVITSTNFVGNLTGNVTGNLTGNVNSTSPLLLQTDGGERFRITGNNELGIAGANYGTSGQVLTSGGSGSAVSWTTIPTQVTIANNSNNRVITGGSGVNLNGEANLVFDGSSLGIGEATPSQRLQVGGNSGDACLSLMRTNAASNDNAWGHVFFENSSDVTLASISARRESAADNAYLAFSTQISGGSNLEKLRITSDGKILIAQTTSNWGSTSANSVIQLKNGVVWDYAGVQLDVGHNYYYNSSGAYKYIRSGYAARQTFHNNTGDIAFWSGGTGSANGTFTWSENLRITSDGKIGIGEDDPDGNKLLIRHSSTIGTNKGHIMLTGDGATNGEGPQIVFSESGSGSSYAGAYIGHAREGSNSQGSLIFATRATSGDANTIPTERLRIMSDGEIKINHTQSSTPLNNTFISIYDANSDSSAIDASGISKNYAMISLHNYGTGVPNDTTGIGFGAGASFGYTKGSIAFARSGSYGTGDLVFLTNNDQDTTMVNDTDEKMRISRDGEVKIATRNSSNGGEVGFRFGSFGIRSQDTGGYNWWRIDNNYGGWQSDMISLRADGNVGIKETNPTAKLHVRDDSNQTQTILKLRNHKSGVNTRPRLAFEAVTSGNQGANAYIQGLAGTDADGDNNSNDSGLAFIVTHGGSGTERTVMEMTHDGDIIYNNFGTLFGHAGMRIYNILSGGPQVAISRASGNPLLLNRNTNDGEIVDLRRGWGAGGSIHVGTNSATYNTSSDYRLKENIVAISDGIARLKTLKPSRFNWIGDTSSTRDGFIAHEVTAVPEAITGTKDEVYSENEPGRNIKAGDPKYQGIDQSRLVPLLTAALQEAVAKIEVLETKVAALEGS